MINARPAQSHRIRPSPLVALALAIALTVGAFVGAPAASAASSGSACASATSGAKVHYLVGFAAHGPAIAGVVIGGFDQSACDGLPVTLVLNGNPAGDPNQPVSELLTTLDSKRDPCTGATLASPLTISGGSITLHGCAAVTDPHGASYASIHDATQLVLEVADAPTTAQVGGVSTAAPSTAAPSGSSAETTPSGGQASGAAPSNGVAGQSTQASPGPGGTSGQGPLASTGVRIALLSAIGLILLWIGVFLLIGTRRRRAWHAE